MSTALRAQPFVQRDGLQLIHDTGPRLHQAVTMPQQLPEIPVPTSNLPTFS
jgi:hypothetical protein